MSMPIATTQPLEREVRSVVVVADHRPQTHRAALSHLYHVLLFYWRLFRAAHPPRVAHSRGRSGAGRHLQQTLHHAWHGHDLLFSDTVDSRCAGELSCAPYDRGEGFGFPPH